MRAANVSSSLRSGLNCVCRGSRSLHGLTPPFTAFGHYTSTPGIVVGTLGVSRYLRVVASVRSLIERAGKKAYTLVVGKLNPAKLANFAEVRMQ